MTTSTMVHVGYYLICSQSVVMIKVPGIVCSKNERHIIQDSSMKFCPNCGHPVVKKDVDTPTCMSLYETVDDPALSATDREFLSQFSAVQAEEAGLKSTERAPREIVLPENTANIDGDCEGIHKLKLSKFTPPSGESLQRLERLVKYTKIEVQEGVIVQIA